MKLISILTALVITAGINYVLFVPSSAVNLMISVFLNGNNTFLLLSDLAISNLIFWIVLDGILFFGQKIKNKYSN
jgi:hypothetical protein